MALINSTLQLQILPAGITDPGQYYLSMTPLSAGKTTTISAGTNLLYYPATGNLFSQIVTTNFLNVGSTLKPITINGALVPQGNASVSLGSPINYWNTFYSNVGNFNNLYSTTVTANTQMTVTNTTQAYPGQQVGAFTTPGGAYIGGNLVVQGNLYVANVVTQNTSTLTVSAPLIYAAPSSAYPYNFDIGLYSDWKGGAANAIAYSGVVRSEQYGYWGFFSNIEQPTTTVDWANTSIIWDQVKSGSMIIANNTAATTAINSGALQVTGGAGIQGAVWAGSLNTASSITGSTISVTAGTGVGIASTGNSVVNLGSNTNYWASAYATQGNFNTVIVGGQGVQAGGNLQANIGSSANFFNHAFIGGGLDLATSTLININGNPGSNGQFISSTGSGLQWVTLSSSSLTSGAATVTLTTTQFAPNGNLTLNLGSTTNWWNNIYGTAIHAQYADLAENYQADKVYAPGTVLMFGGAQEVTVADADTTRVAGVVSTNPATLMNGLLTGPNVVALALQGRVPCQVIGPVAKGDLMVSAGFGYAKVNNTPQVGTIIGKALQDFPGFAKGVIEVVVGRV